MLSAIFVSFGIGLVTLANDDYSMCYFLAGCFIPIGIFGFFFLLIKSLIADNQYGEEGN